MDQRRKERDEQIKHLRRLRDSIAQFFPGSANLAEIDAQIDEMIAKLDAANEAADEADHQDWLDHTRTIRDLQSAGTW